MNTHQQEPNGRAKKRIYHPETTAEQRRTMFKIWEETDNINYACRKAGVSRSTFFYWRPRFEKEGYSAIEKPLSNAPKNPRRIAESIADEVRRLKRENPHWGKERIAAQINRKHGEKSIGSSTVRRILLRAGL